MRRQRHTKIADFWAKECGSSVLPYTQKVHRYTRCKAGECPWR